MREKGGFTLIDTGLASTGPKILAAARDLGVPITRIALTHKHSDHAGALDLLCAILPGLEILIPARYARFLIGDMTLDSNEPQTRFRGGYVRRETKPTHLLRAGDRVGSLDVVAAPGHTPGQVAFFDTRDRTLIAGDALQTRGGIAVAGVVRPLFPFPAMGTWHLPTALERARRLRALNPSRIAVGHGAVLDEPGAAMDGAIAAAERKIERQAAHAR